MFAKLENEVKTLSDNFLGCLYDEKSLPRCLKDNTCLQTCFNVLRFIAEPVGTHWYHAHSSALRSDGLSGAFIVLPKQVGCYKTFCSSV